MDKYYDNLGHVLYIGAPVMIKTSNIFVYGHVIDMNMSDKGEKYSIIPDIGYSANKEITLKKIYKNISWKNIYSINVKRK